jgi:hypothetical protein
MERTICEKCGERQPADWTPGDFCVACGSAVRREVRCAWCAGWSPAGKYCRSCGCELVEDRMYGAARMLKNAGVDRFSIARKLGEMDPEQVENLSRIYAAQLAVVIRRCEETRLCETYLLHKNYSIRLEESLVPLLPMEKAQLDSLASGPAGPFDHRPDLLPEIARISPLRATRLLAGMALLRQGIHLRDGIAAAREALAGEDREFAVEAALCLGHWRVRLESIFGDYFPSGAGIDRHRLAQVASLVPPESPLHMWAAAALALGRFSDGALPEDTAEASEVERMELDSLRDSLRDGLAASDPDLRLTCALALGDEDYLAAQLGASDEERRRSARRLLARRKSPAVRRCLSEGPDEIRKEVLDVLWTPLPGALIDGVLEVVARGDADLRRTGLPLLVPSLTAEMVDLLVDVALRETDLDTLKTLLNAKNLPGGSKVVRRVIEAGLFQEIYPALQEGARYVDFSDPGIARLAAQNDPEALVVLAEGQLRDLSASEDPADAARILSTGRFLARTAFDPGPSDLRCRAYGLLSSNRFWSWIGPQSIRSFFGNPGEFLGAMTRLLRDPDAGQMWLRVLPDFQEHWADLGPCFDEHRRELRAFLDSILDLIRTRYLGNKADLAELIVTMVPLYPEESLPAIVALLGNRSVLVSPSRIFQRLREGYGVFGPCLGNYPNFLQQIVVALIELYETDDWARDEIQPTARDLLATLAAAHPGCREQIFANFGFRVVEDAFAPGRTGEVMRELAETLGIKIPCAEVIDPAGEGSQRDESCSENQDGEPQALDLLDNKVIFPGEPFPTLSEYCDFLKAMGSVADPVGLLANRGLSADDYVRCVTAWSEIISQHDDFAIRYSQLVAG